MQRPRLHQPMYIVYCLLYFAAASAHIPCMVKDRSRHNGPRNVLDLRGSHHVTQRALAEIGKDIKDRGMVAAASRRTMHRHRTKFANHKTPFGNLIQERPLTLQNGGCISLPFLHPAPMLWVCCRDCPEFNSLFSSVLKRQRLQLVVYSDEIVPGRELQS